MHVSDIPGAPPPLGGASVLELASPITTSCMASLGFTRCETKHVRGPFGVLQVIPLAYYACLIMPLHA
eukprot:scaffold58637_cov26-Tisochrysis_lutea.AAC.1